MGNSVRGVEGAAPYRGVTIPGGEGQQRYMEGAVRIDTGGTPGNRYFGVDFPVGWRYNEI